MADEGKTADMAEDEVAHAGQGAGRVVAAADRASRERRGPEREGGGAKEALTSAPRVDMARSEDGGEVNFTPGRREKNVSHHRFALQSTAERVGFRTSMRQPTDMTRAAHCCWRDWDHRRWRHDGRTVAWALRGRRRELYAPCERARGTTNSLADFRVP